MDYLLKGSSGKPIKARVEVANGRVTLQSSGGRSGTSPARNPEYAKAFNAIFDRINVPDIAIGRVLLDSVPAQAFPEADRVLATRKEFESVPLAELKNRIRTRMRRFGRTSEMPAQGGNANKKITIDTDLSDTELVRRLRLLSTTTDNRAVLGNSQESGRLTKSAATDAEDFARHFFRIVARESKGSWLAYRDIYNRTTAELPENKFVQYVAVHKRRRAIVSGTLARAMAEFPGIERRKDGEAQSSRVWFRTSPKTFEIVTSKAKVRRGFANWRKALELDGQWLGRSLSTPEGLLAMTLPRQAGPKLGLRVGLGYDLKGRDFVVQINEPSEPETHNVLSAIAKDSKGRRFLVRQGTLQRNRQNSARVTGEEFERRTGLVPLVTKHNGQPSRRKWYLVADLDATAREIRRATADFVERCDIARQGGKLVDVDADDSRLDELFGNDEDGGKYSRKKRTIEEQTIIKLQGHVWRALKNECDSKAIVMAKPRHRSGYEVDAAIEAPGGPVLIEIKTSARASDIQTAVGQLNLYPRLIPRMAGYSRLLLVRGHVSTSLKAAVEQCGIRLFSYEMSIEGDEVRNIELPADFLKICGLL